MYLGPTKFAAALMSLTLDFHQDGGTNKKMQIVATCGSLLCGEPMPLEGMEQALTTVSLMAASQTTHSISAPAMKTATTAWVAHGTTRMRLQMLTAPPSKCAIHTTPTRLGGIASRTFPTRASTPTLAEW